MTCLECNWLSPRFSAAKCVAFLPNGHLLVGRGDSSVEVIQIPAYRVLRKIFSGGGLLPGSKPDIRNIHPLSDEIFVTTGLHGCVDLWSIERERLIISELSRGGPILDSLVYLDSETENDTVTARSGTNSSSSSSASSDSTAPSSHNIPPPSAPSPVWKLLAACADGSIRSFRIDGLAQKNVNAFSEEISIRLDGVLLKEPTAKILSVVMRGKSELFFGTSNSSVQKWDLKTRQSVYKVHLRDRVKPISFDATRRKRLREEMEAAAESMEKGEDSGETLFQKFTRLEAAKAAIAAAEKEGEQDANFDCEILTITYCQNSDTIVCGDSNGIVTVIDPLTCTILNDFKRHEAPVKRVVCIESAVKSLGEVNSSVVSNGNSAIISVGVDGRLITYIDQPDGIGEGMGGVNKVVGVVRYAHEVDAEDIAYSSENGYIVVPGLDGSLTLYKDGLNTIQDISLVPLRLLPTCLIRAGKALPSVHKYKRLIMEIVNSEVLRVWSITPSPVSPDDRQLILKEASTLR